MADISSIPTELRLKVLEHLPDRDIGSMRLTCQTFAEEGLDVILRNTPQNIRLHFNVAEPDLNVLNAVLVNGLIVRRVKEIRFCCFYIPGAEAHLSPWPLSDSRGHFLANGKDKYTQSTYPKVDLPVISSMRRILQLLKNIPTYLGCTVDPSGNYPFGFQKLAHARGIDRIRMIYDALEVQTIYQEWVLYVMFCALKGVDFHHDNIHFLLTDYELRQDFRVQKATRNFVREKYAMSKDDDEAVIEHLRLTYAKEISSYLLAHTHMDDQTLSTLRRVTKSITWLASSFPTTFEDLQKSPLSYSQIVRVLYRAAYDSNVTFRLQGPNPDTDTEYIESFHHLPCHGIRRLELVDFRIEGCKPIARIFSMSPNIESLTMKSGFIESDSWYSVFRFLEYEMPFHYLHLQDLFQRNHHYAIKDDEYGDTVSLTITVEGKEVVSLSDSFYTTSTSSHLALTDRFSNEECFVVLFSHKAEQ